MKILKRIKYYLKNKFKKTKLTKNDLKGYKTLLKIITHPKAEPPILDINKTVIRYFISLPNYKISLIIDEDQAEIVNSHKIWKLELNPIVYQKVIKKLKQIKKQQVSELEESIKGKKQDIFDELYNSIK